MASSSRVHVQPEASSSRYEDRRRVRNEVTKLFFAVDELTARNHWLQLERTRLKQKYELIQTIATTMMVEGQADSTVETRFTLRAYAETILGILRRP